MLRIKYTVFVRVERIEHTSDIRMRRFLTFLDYLVDDRIDRALLDDARYHRLGALRDRSRFLSRDASAWLFRKLDNTDNSSLARAVRTRYTQSTFPPVDA